MPNCELNVLDIPVSPSLPAATDYVMFHLADGTTVIRTWSQIKATLSGVPDDAEFETQASGSNINNVINGNSQIILTNFVGSRIRVHRGSVPQSTMQGQYTWNKITGELTVTPAPVSGEFWKIEAY